MEILSMPAAHQATQTLVLKAVTRIAAALLVALLVGSLLAGNWTLPMDPVVGATFTA